MCDTVHRRMHVVDATTDGSSILSQRTSSPLFSVRVMCGRPAGVIVTAEAVEGRASFLALYVIRSNPFVQFSLSLWLFIVATQNKFTTLSVMQQLRYSQLLGMSDASDSQMQSWSKTSKDGDG